VRRGEFQGGQPGPSPPQGVEALELLNLWGSLLLMLTMRSIRTEAEPQHLRVLMYFYMSTPFNVE